MVQSCILKKLLDHLFLIETTGIHPHPNIEQIRKISKKKLITRRKLCYSNS